MAKNNFKKPNHPEPHKKHDLKRKDKFATKLKKKLKSAIFNKKNAVTETLISGAETQKSQIKCTIPILPSTNIESKLKHSKPKTNSIVSKPKKGKKKQNSLNKSLENHQKNAKMNGHQQYSGDKNQAKHLQNDQAILSKKKQNIDSSTEKVMEKKKKNKNKKKQKEKLMQSTLTLSATSKISHDQKNSGKAKRNDDIKANVVSGKKRLKTVGGFVESNANDDEETKLVTEKLQKRKEKQKSKSKLRPDTESAPRIKVHKMNGCKLDGANTNSDSDVDSYIDKFFGGDDDHDENHIYSLDEIETKNENEFLAKKTLVNESVTKSNNTCSVNTPLEKKTKKMQKSKIEEIPTAENSLNTQNKLVNYKENANDNQYNYDKFMWPEGYDEENDCNDDDMMYDGSGSEISLGSEVIESDDTYECDSTDVDSMDMDEYEDDISYDGYTSNSESYCSEYEYDSGSSRDTYDDYMNSSDDDHSSNDDPDYMDSAYDDLRVAQGTAITHNITDERIKLFENDTESRIIELPKSDSDDDSCVDLIPINIKKVKFQRMEREKMIFKETQRKENQLREEKKRLAYEKSVENYYNMDNINKNSTMETNDSVTVIKCPRNFNHSSFVWEEDKDDGETLSDESISICSKVKSEKCIAVTIVDPTEAKSSTKFKPNKTNNHTNPMKQSDQSDNKMEQSFNMSGSYNENEPSLCNSEGTDEDEDEEEKGEDEDEDEEITMPTEMRQANVLESQFFNSVNSRHVLLLLRKTLHFHGSLHVKLIAGKATAFGYKLKSNKTVTVHSPRGHGLICLIPNSNEATEIDSNKSNLTALDELKDDFYSQDLSYLKTEFNSTNDAILLLERDQTNKGVNMIERYMRETVFPNINAFNNESPFYSSEFVLHCKFLNEPENGLIINDEWLTLNLRENSKLITIGGKGVGKSTFIRYLINANFEKFKQFLFIDLDIGQPELFVPQTLSATIVTEPILGPGYLQNVKPAKAVLFGDINILPDPIKYWRCVTEIFTFCSAHENCRKIPWIINTMGYNRGFGTELIACILKIFKPTDLVQIQSRSTMKNFDQIIKADVVNKFKFNVFKSEMNQINGNCTYKTHILNAIRGKGHQQQLDMTAKDLRYTMILAKLGNCLKSNCDWLTSVKPFEASLNDLSILVTSGEGINSSDYLSLLNGNLVYLCENHSENDNDIVDCHGIGIVRSVDHSTNKLYLLSTIPLTELRNVNVLAIGAIPLPSAVFLNQHSQIRGSVPYVYNSDKFIGSKQVAKHIFRAESKSSNKPIQLMEEH